MPTISERKTRLVGAVLGLVILASAVWISDASADFRMRIDSNGEGVVATDLGATGELQLNPTIGSFQITSGQGTSKPQIGGIFPLLGELDLHAEITASSAGTVNVYLADTFFASVAGPLSMTSAFTGSLNAPEGSSITLNSYVNPDNLVPDLGPNSNVVMALPGVSSIPAGSFTAAGVNGITFTSDGSGLQNFSALNSIGFMPSSPHSLFAVVSVTFTGPGTASFGDNQQTSAVPVPGTVLMLAAGLAAAAGCRAVAHRRTKSRGRFSG